MECTASNVMENTTCKIMKEDTTSNIVRSTRDMRPAHYSMKIESFSFLVDMLEKTGAKSYESEIFEASGYKWKLSLYPNGDKERNVTGYMSLYLILQETDILPLGWEIKANFKFFVYDQIRDKYLTIQDAAGKETGFHEMKKDWGFSHLLPLTDFNDTTKGYLLHGKCVFGVEIFVNNYSYTGRGECLALPKKLNNDIYTWEFTDFSTKTSSGACYSDVFTLGNCKWRVQLYPKGFGVEKGNYVSLFLRLDSSETSPRVYAEYKLRILNQNNQKHKERTANHLFTPAEAWGWSGFLLLKDTEDASTGFLVKDTLIIQAEITRISTLESFS